MTMYKLKVLTERIIGWDIGVHRALGPGLNTVLLEIKAVTAIGPPRIAQILTYLRMSRLPVGLLMNFHERRLVDGVSRYAV
nr:GxxExxY protein [uncultured Rhodopila sp.]